MKTKFVLAAVIAAAMSLCGATQAQGQVKLIAKGALTESSAGLFADLSGLAYNLENGAPANLLGGLGSGLAWAYGDTFLALPDRGPNAVSFDSLVDDTVDLSTGKTTHEYAYLLTTGSGASEITALNDHDFLVDERDGKGLGDGSKAKVKQIFKIDLAGAVDVQDMDGTAAAANAVSKTLFLDVVKELTANGITADQIPAKLEGLALGADVDNHGTTTHTLWLANDNDFLQDLNGAGTNPNQFFVFGFTDADLAGSLYVPEQEHGSAKKD